MEYKEVEDEWIFHGLAEHDCKDGKTLMLSPQPADAVAQALT
jgi:hypothetical protein